VTIRLTERLRTSHSNFEYREFDIDRPMSALEEFLFVGGFAVVRLYPLPFSLFGEKRSSQTQDR
jgi:hypothetical protein